MKNKLILINPGDINRRHNIFYEPIELGIIASLTPKDRWDVEILDFRLSNEVFKEADIIAITSKISDINYAYKIISHYRKNGTTTILGGVHATLCTKEASIFADVVVIGEAESVWAQIISDFENNSLKKQYFGYSDLLYNIDRSYYKHWYKTATIQFSRGCPLSCDFCCVGSIHKQRHVYRDVNNLISEIKTVKQKLLFFTDENLYGFTSKNKEIVISFFKKLIKEKVNKRWIAMVSINAGLDDEFLKLARKSGCRMLLIGFEAEDSVTLNNINKKLNSKLINDYNKIINNIHKHRISVCGAFMLGLPSDNETKIIHRVQFIIKSKIDVFFMTTYTPFPGSKMYDELNLNDEILYNKYPDDWSLYNQNLLVFKHKLMNDFNNIFINSQNEIRRPKLLLRKFIYNVIYTKSISCALYANYYNFNHFGLFDKVFILRLINNWFEKKQKKYFKR